MCDYCRSSNLPCEAGERSRRRPFYQVSGEVYEYSIKLLRHFVSEEELPELTVERIQDFLQRLDGEGPDALSWPLFRFAESPTDGQSPSTHSDAKSDETSETLEADEHPLLQEDLGCMLLDSMGKYRASSLLLQYPVQDDAVVDTTP